MNKLINGLMIKILPVSNVIKEIIGSSLSHDHNELVIISIKGSKSSQTHIHMTKIIISFLIS